MRLGKSVTIHGKHDTCTVQRHESGNVSVSSITLQVEELDEFPQILRDALAEVTSLNPIPKKEGQ